MGTRRSIITLKNDPDVKKALLIEHGLKDDHALTYPKLEDH